MAESSETEDLTQNYTEEDPSILSEETFQKLAKAYGMSMEKVKTIAKGMSKTRRAVQTQEQE